MSGVSQPPGMNTCVKQKKLDEEGGRVSEERGLELVMRRLGWGLGGDGLQCRMSVWPSRPCGRSLLCMCVLVPVFVCPCIHLSHSHTARY